MFHLETKNRSRSTLALAGIAVTGVASFMIGLSPALASEAAIANACDRICLQGFIADYVAAMVKHDPSGLPLADGVTATENGKKIKLGQGIWKSIGGVLSQPQYISDIPAQQAGYLGVISDADKPSLFGLRLKIVNHKIAEIETILTHNGEGGPAFEPEGFIYREAPYMRDVPAPMRTSVSGLLNAANHYWDVETTTHDGAAVPFTDDCWHFENGMNTTWERPFFANELDKLNQPAYRAQPSDGRIWTCAREIYLSSGSWKDARDRHFVVDADRGLILNIVNVDVGGPVGSPALTRAKAPAAMELPAALPIDGPGVAPLGMSMAGLRSTMSKAYTAYHFQLMRIVDGKISRQQDVIHLLPSSMAN